MSRFSVVTLLTYAVLLSACGGTDARVEGHDADLVPASAPPGVMLVGILDEEHCESASFTPAVLANGLRRADPDAVVLPFPADIVTQALACQDPLCTQTLRVSNHVNACWFWDGLLPWLRQSPAVSVHTFESVTPEEASDLHVWIDQTGGEPSARAYFRAQASLMMAELQAFGGYESPGWLQSELYAMLTEDVDRWLSYYAEEAMGAGGKLRVLDLMTERVLAAIQETDVQYRIVVLVPARSRWYVDRVLATTSARSRLPATDIFPYGEPSP